MSIKYKPLCLYKIITKSTLILEKYRTSFYAWIMHDILKARGGRGKTSNYLLPNECLCKWIEEHKQEGIVRWQTLLTKVAKDRKVLESPCPIRTQHIKEFQMILCFHGSEIMKCTWAATSYFHTYQKMTFKSGNSTLAEEFICQ